MKTFNFILKTKNTATELSATRAFALFVADALAVLPWRGTRGVYISNNKTSKK